MGRINTLSHGGKRKERTESNQIKNFTSHLQSKKVRSELSRILHLSSFPCQHKKCSEGRVIDNISENQNGGQELNTLPLLLTSWQITAKPHRSGMNCKMTFAQYLSALCPSFVIFPRHLCKFIFVVSCEVRWAWLKTSRSFFRSLKASPDYTVLYLQ